MDSNQEVTGGRHDYGSGLISLSEHPEAVGRASDVEGLPSGSGVWCDPAFIPPWLGHVENLSSRACEL